MSAQVWGVPIELPIRSTRTLNHGSVASQYSPMPRTRRGGRASSTIAVMIMSPSKATWPAWFPMSMTAPVGTRSIPRTLQRK